MAIREYVKKKPSRQVPGGIKDLNTEGEEGGGIQTLETFPLRKRFFLQPKNGKWFLQVIRNWLP